MTILPMHLRPMHAMFIGLWPGLLFFVTGCDTTRDCSLTHRLWSNDEMRRFYEPASNPRLELFYVQAQRDVLAVYDETHETRQVARRRAYLVDANRSRVEAGRKPHFVNPQRSQGLPAIPLATNTPAHVPSGAKLQVVVSPDGRQFTLGGDFGDNTYNLPVYPDSRAVVGRVLLSPLAVTGDVLMVGAVAGVVAVFLWAQGGAPVFWR